MTLRKIVFWVHLPIGLAAGAVILFMSATGVLLAFEPQVAAFSERHVRTVTPPGPDARRLGLDAILARVGEARPDSPPVRVTVRSDRAAAVMLGFGAEDALFVDPYSGKILGPRSAVHRALHAVVEWHRWLGSRDVGRPVTGAANTAFLVLALSGLYVWWPRPWSRRLLTAVAILNPRLSGRARDFNWHNSVGASCAAVLVVLTLTGLVMSYRWANDLLYRLAGDQPPAASFAGDQREGSRRVDARPDGRPPLGLDAIWARAAERSPGWVTITLRLPRRAGAPITAFIEEAGFWHPSPRSQLALDGVTGAVVRWEPFAQASLGRTLRSWVRPLHTGEAGGVVGQLVAGLASAGGVLLVWTGWALAWRRLRARRASADGREAEASPPQGALRPDHDIH